MVAASGNEKEMAADKGFSLDMGSTWDQQLTLLEGQARLNAVWLDIRERLQHRIQVVGKGSRARRRFQLGEWSFTPDPGITSERLDGGICQHCVRGVVLATRELPSREWLRELIGRALEVGDVDEDYARVVRSMLAG